MTLHAVHADGHHSGNIVVRTNDADLLIIFLSNIIHHIENSHLLYEVGNNHDNSRDIVMNN